nr:hypothetical protein Iba_chr04cCG18070 [Ipomoea batatas]
MAEPDAREHDSNPKLSPKVPSMSRSPKFQLVVGEDGEDKYRQPKARGRLPGEKGRKSRQVLGPSSEGHGCPGARRGKKRIFCQIWSMPPESNSREPFQLFLFSSLCFPMSPAWREPWVFIVKPVQRTIKGGFWVTSGRTSLAALKCTGLSGMLFSNLVSSRRGSQESREHFLMFSGVAYSSGSDSHWPRPAKTSHHPFTNFLKGIQQLRFLRMLKYPNVVRKSKKQTKGQLFKAKKHAKASAGSPILSLFDRRSKRKKPTREIQRPHPNDWCPSTGMDLESRFTKVEWKDMGKQLEE